MREGSLKIREYPVLSGSFRGNHWEKTDSSQNQEIYVELFKSYDSFVTVSHLFSHFPLKWCSSVCFETKRVETARLGPRFSYPPNLSEEVIDYN